MSIGIQKRDKGEIAAARYMRYLFSSSGLGENFAYGRVRFLLSLRGFCATNLGRLCQGMSKRRGERREDEGERREGKFAWGKEGLIFRKLKDERAYGQIERKFCVQWQKWDIGPILPATARPAFREN